jgi:hypothetical protein
MNIILYSPLAFKCVKLPFRPILRLAEVLKQTIYIIRSSNIEAIYQERVPHVGQTLAANFVLS